MREWDEEISLWLARMKPEPAREAWLVREAIRRLDNHYQMSLSKGATEHEAYRAALAALDEDRLFAAAPIMVWTRYTGGRGSTSVGDYLEWKRRNSTFQYLEAWTGGSFNVATLGRPEQVEGSVMTPGFFRMTGTQMFLGRDFLPEEGDDRGSRIEDRGSSDITY